MTLAALTSISGARESVEMFVHELTEAECREVLGHSKVGRLVRSQRLAAREN